jgi:hypothetical protein
MSERARERSARQHAEETREESARRTAIVAEAERNFPALPGESEEVIAWGEHIGHRSHTHVNTTVCSCGAVLGVFSVVIEDGWCPPDHCPICRARGVEER